MLSHQFQDYVARHLPSFLAARRAEARSLPWVVQRDLELFLTCRDPFFGHAVFVSPSCGRTFRLPFSCKRRSVCSHCISRRREERTHRLMTKVLSDLPYRHWVLCLPIALRRGLRFHPDALRDVQSCFVNAIFDHLRLAFARLHGRSGYLVHPGLISVPHRVSAGLAANIHFHGIAIDGVFVERTRGGPIEFIGLPPPTDDEVTQVALDVCLRTRDVLVRHGLWKDAEGEPRLTGVRGTLALGESTSIAFDGRAVHAEEVFAAATDGGRMFTIFARDRVEKGDRHGLENLVRYLLAPPFDERQFELMANDDLVLHRKRPAPDGTTSAQFAPHEVIHALTAMVADPKSHALGYHGVLGRSARLRKQITPGRKPDPRATLSLTEDDMNMRSPEERHAWKQIHLRAHRDEFLRCPDCQDKLILVELVGKNLRYTDLRWHPPDI